jgi:hypothetical protein
LEIQVIIGRIMQTTRAELKVWREVMKPAKPQLVFCPLVFVLNGCGSSANDNPRLEVTDVTVVSDTEVTVSLSNTWTVAKDSETGYLSGDGFIIEFTKTADDWTGEVGPKWMS